MASHAADRAPLGIRLDLAHLAVLGLDAERPMDVIPRVAGDSVSHEYAGIADTDDLGLACHVGFHLAFFGEGRGSEE